MKTIKISIPDMTSSHCQMRVNSVLSSIEGISIKEIKATEATLAINHETLEQQAISAIEQAGYQAQTIDVNRNEPEQLRFKTNINCGGCVAKVTPILNAQPGIEQWAVDTDNKDKVLTIKSKGITSDEVIESIKQSGFKIEVL